MTQRPSVGFVGLTHLGVNSAAATAERGFRTIGFDPDATTVKTLVGGDLSIAEPGLQDLLEANVDRLTFTSAPEALSECDIVYISADVPTDAQSSSDLSSIHDLIALAIRHIKDDGLLIVLSQVPPGFTRNISGIDKHRLIYQVETLVFGRAVDRALHPERFIVGLHSASATLDPRYRALLEAFECPILPMVYESAELAKIAINCCLVASIGVANTLAELCEHVGADWSEIAPALKLDARIGPAAYLTPGLGIAGGNLERDLTTVLDLSERYETDAGVVRALLANSRHRQGWAARTVLAALPKPEGRLAVWGLTYKENTHSVRNSPSLATLAQLKEFAVTVHDPVAPPSVVRHPNVTAAMDPLDALADADALLILTPWAVYRSVTADDVARRLKGKLVLDPYRVMDKDAARAAGLDYRALGLGGAVAW